MGGRARRAKRTRRARRARRARSVRRWLDLKWIELVMIAMWMVIR